MSKLGQAIEDKEPEGKIQRLLDTEDPLSVSNRSRSASILTRVVATELRAKERKYLASLLLDRGANINTVDDVYGTALAAAASRVGTSVVQVLLDRGAGINIVAGKYGTALAAAALWGRTENVSLLLKRGAKIDMVGGEYGTALAAAAFGGSADTVSLLLDRRAKIDAVVDSKYGTALAAAASGKGTNNVELLLDRGANINMFGGEYSTLRGNATSPGSETVPREQQTTLFLT